MRKTGRRGFSIIELLVAIVIIGILVAVLLPVISRRTEQARIARAQSDVQNLAEALDRIAIDTGFYTRLFLVNYNLRGNDPALAFNRENSRQYQRGLTNLLIGQPWFGTPNGAGRSNFFIDPNTGDYAAQSDAAIIQRFLATESRFDGTSAWNGPYLNFQSDSNVFATGLGAGQALPDGFPDDPWGNNYLLFTRAGLILEPSGIIATVAVDQSPIDGTFAPGSTFDTRVFDRPVVLSLGPNGIPGDGVGAPDINDRFFGSGDDIFRQFGR